MSFSLYAKGKKVESKKNNFKSYIIVLLFGTREREKKSTENIFNQCITT